MDPATIAMLVSGGMSLYDKIKGVPTPDDKDASGMQGEQYGQFMDKAFPGTTPWERLGASTGGQPAANVGADTARAVEKAKFRQERTIADNANRAHIISATSPMGAAAVDSGLMKYAGIGGFSKGFPGGADKVPSEVERNIAESEGILGKGMRGVKGLGQNTIGKLASSLGTKSVSIEQNVRDFFRNRMRSPNRFARGR